MGVEGKGRSDIRYLVGIISNIHAVRHYDEYLRAFTDIVWTRTTSDNTIVPANMYNLFDGIVALTHTMTHDEWVQEIFNF